MLGGIPAATIKALPALHPIGAARQINAVVVSSGLMDKTVKVRIGVQRWNNVIRKKLTHKTHLLVHDPASSLNTGDIISITPGWRVSKTVHHVVSSIIAPFGSPIAARPPVPTLEERLQTRIERQRLKDLRRAGGKEKRWPGWVLKEVEGEGKVAVRAKDVNREQRKAREAEKKKRSREAFESSAAVEDAAVKDAPAEV